MKRKMMVITLTAAMLAGITAAPVWAEEAASDEGKVLNIYCWNEEFKSRLTDHYPGYEEVDGTHGKIGDVNVVWKITPSDDNAYQNNLDETLLKQADAAADDKIDLFLVEADYALKYVNTEYTMSVADLGITDEEVADWDTFKATAAELKEKGYQMTSTVNDSYRVFSNNVSSPWVVDGKITVDDNIKNWVDMSKEMVDAGETATYELWSDDWSKGFFKDSNVFAYFGPAWFIDFSMSADQDGSVGKDGGWTATEGPQGFYWGGTWITAATGTNNPALVADIMRTMTTNVDVMKEIVTADNDFVNNKPAMEEMAADESYGDAVLGGQNPLAMFCAGADKIDLSDMSIYDQGCNEEFQNAMKNYFEGNASYDEALDLFYKAVVEKYLELTY